MYRYKVMSHGTRMMQDYRSIAAAADLWQGLALRLLVQGMATSTAILVAQIQFPRNEGLLMTYTLADIANIGVISILVQVIQGRAACAASGTVAHMTRSWTNIGRHEVNSGVSCASHLPPCNLHGKQRPQLLRKGAIACAS